MVRWRKIMYSFNSWRKKWRLTQKLVLSSKFAKIAMYYQNNSITVQNTCVLPYSPTFIPYLTIMGWHMFKIYIFICQVCCFDSAQRTVVRDCDSWNMLDTVQHPCAGERAWWQMPWLPLTEPKLLLSIKRWYAVSFVLILSLFSTGSSFWSSASRVEAVSIKGSWGHIHSKHACIGPMLDK